MPRELGDLPYAHRLEPAGEPVIDGEYGNALFESGHWDAVDARNARFAECAFRAVTLDAGHLSWTRVEDSWLHGVRFTGTELTDSAWIDTEITEGAFSGVEGSGADLRRVTFHNCKLDSVNLRGARLTKVDFVDCVLRHVDVGGATLTEVRFPGTEIVDLMARDARMKKVDFRDARSLGMADGVGSLTGATVSREQLLELAPAFAASIGLAVG